MSAVELAGDEGGGDDVGDGSEWGRGTKALMSSRELIKQDAPHASRRSSAQVHANSSYSGAGTGDDASGGRGAKTPLRAESRTPREIVNELAGGKDLESSDARGLGGVKRFWSGIVLNILSPREDEGGVNKGGGLPPPLPARRDAGRVAERGKDRHEKGVENDIVDVGLVGMNGAEEVVSDEIMGGGVNEIMGGGVSVLSKALRKNQKQEQSSLAERGLFAIWYSKQRVSVRASERERENDRDILLLTHRLHTAPSSCSLLLHFGCASQRTRSTKRA